MGKHRKQQVPKRNKTKETTRNYGNERLGTKFAVPIFSENPAKLQSFPRSGIIDDHSPNCCYP